MENEFYVYIYLDPRKTGKYKYGEYEFDYEPFYVGRGKDYRFRDHLTEAKNNKKSYKCNKIRKILKETSKEPIILKIKENISFEEANNLEEFLIKLIGRCNIGTGPLTNLTDGGKGTKGFESAFKGKIHSEKTRKLISDKVSGSKNGMFGKKGNQNPFYEDHRFAGENHPLFGKFGKDNPNFGQKRSKEFCELMSKIHKGIQKTEEHKKKLSESLKGKLIGIKNPNHKYKYEFINNNGKIFITDWLEDFCKNNGLRAQTIRTYLSQGINTYKGWTFKQIRIGD